MASPLWLARTVVSDRIQHHIADILNPYSRRLLSRPTRLAAQPPNRSRHDTVTGEEPNVCNPLYYKDFYAASTFDQKFSSAAGANRPSRAAAAIVSIPSLRTGGTGRDRPAAQPPTAEPRPTRMVDPHTVWRHNNPSHRWNSSAPPARGRDETLCIGEVRHGMSH